MLICADDIQVHTFPKVNDVDDVAQNILEKRYLHEGETTWEDVVTRTVNFVIQDDGVLKDRIWELMAHRYFLPNSPTLVNSGKKHAGLSACVPANGILFTNVGISSMKDVIYNDKITKVFDGENYVDIIAKVVSGTKKVYKVETERGLFVEVTKDHLVHTQKTRSTINGVWKRIDELTKDDQLEFDSHEKIFPDNNFDSDLATMLGYLYTDGCFTKGRSNERVLEIIVNSEEETDQILKINKKLTGDNNLNVIKKEKYTRLRGYGTERYKFLEKYEPFFSDQTHIPYDIYNSNKKSISAFLSACFSADGTISIVKKGSIISLSSISKGFIISIGHLLSLYGIRHSIHSFQDKRTDHNRKESHFITITDKHSHKIFFDSIGFFNPSKQNKLKKYLLNNPLLPTQEHKRHLRLRVKNITFIGEKDVYDIQTASEKFLCNGFVVHNCFVVGMEDTIEDIFTTKLNFALIARKGGGCGTTLSNLRPKNAPVAGSTHGYAGGPVDFFNTICHDMSVITQAGFRAMAMMGTLHVRHPDIKQFILAKQEEGKMTNTNISVIVDNAFMQAVEDDVTYWTEFNGEKYEEYRAKEIFDMIVEGAWRNGEPGVVFEERINDSPYKYTGQKIQGLNPCGEQILPANGVCNLGSLDVSKFVVDGEFNDLMFISAICYAVQFLDRVIDVGQFPTEDITTWAKDNRPIGLGIMGFADYLLKLEIPYGSQESIDHLTRILEYMDVYSKFESDILADEFGIPKEPAKLPNPRRNITLLSIAPTGTIALLAGCSNSIEPVFSEVTIRKDNTGTYDIRHPLAHKEYFRCAVSANGAAEVTWKEHVDVQSAAQTIVDSGISKTINLPALTRAKTVGDIFMYAWAETDVKGLTVYRNQSRKEEVLTPKNIKKNKCPVCGRVLIKEAGCMGCSDCDYSVCEIG